MALSVLQIKVSARASGGTIARTFDSNVTAGSLIVAHTAAWSSTGGEPTVSDPTNGTYAAASTSGYTFAGDTNSRITLNSFSNNASNGSLTVTSDPPGATSDNDLTLIEVGGAAASSARDVTVTNSGAISSVSGSTSVTTGTLAQAAEIVISSASHTVDDRTLGTDTTDSFTQANENESNSGGQTFHLQYKITSVTTSLVVNVAYGGGISSGTWFAGVASFKEGSAAAPVLEQTHYRWRNDDGGLGIPP